MRISKQFRQVGVASVVCGCLLVVASSGCSGQPRQTETTVRVLSYNIRHGRGMDNVVDLERIAAVINRLEPDLVALQEVDRGVERTDRVDQPARLAELTGMESVFERNIVYQGGDYGNAVLSRLPVEYHRNHHLPQLRPNEQRGMLEVHVRAGRQKLAFFATHFDYRGDNSERMASVDMFESLLAEHQERPVILAGDINDTPDSPVMDRLREFMLDSFVMAGIEEAEGFTFRADNPTKRIDYILYNRQPGLRCIEHRVIPEPMASDHRPLLAVFVLSR